MHQTPSAPTTPKVVRVFERRFFSERAVPLPRAPCSEGGGHRSYGTAFRRSSSPFPDAPASAPVRGADTNASTDSDAPSGPSGPGGPSGTVALPPPNPNPNPYPNPALHSFCETQCPRARSSRTASAPLCETDGSDTPSPYQPESDDVFESPQQETPAPEVDCHSNVPVAVPTPAPMPAAISPIWSGDIDDNDVEDIAALAHSESLTSLSLRPLLGVSEAQFTATQSPKSAAAPSAAVLSLGDDLPLTLPEASEWDTLLHTKRTQVYKHMLGNLDTLRQAVRDASTGKRKYRGKYLQQQERNHELQETVVQLRTQLQEQVNRCDSLRRANEQLARQGNFFKANASAVKEAMTLLQDENCQFRLRQALILRELEQTRSTFGSRPRRHSDVASHPPNAQASRRVPTPPPASFLPALGNDGQFHSSASPSAAAEKLRVNGSASACASPISRRQSIGQLSCIEEHACGNIEMESEEKENVLDGSGSGSGFNGQDDSDNDGDAMAQRRIQLHMQRVTAICAVNAAMTVPCLRRKSIMLGSNAKILLPAIAMGK